MYKLFIKPLLDFFLSTLAITIISPVFLLITLTFLILGSHPFFIQTRPGKNGKLFRLIKFKTMNDRRDKSGDLLPDADRLTLFGHFLRKTSLDEIPQLINVIKGDMSLIGPRPLLVEYLPLYNSKQARRHEVLPGITGLAQVKGRNAISWEKRFDYDIYYVDNLSFHLDMEICLLTLRKVLLSEGISSDNNVTMEKFTGNN